MIKNQTGFSCCAAFAMATAVEAVQNGLEASPLFIWHHMGDKTPQAAAFAVKRFGVCPEDLWTTHPSREMLVPPRSLYRVSRQWTIKAVVRCDQASQVMLFLDRGVRSVVGYDVGVLTKLGLVRPDLSSPLHVSCIVGHVEGGFVVQNSWGQQWNNGGTFVLPMEEFRHHHIKEVLAVVT